MLTITFDPACPQDALEDCACIAELLSDYITQRRPDLDIPECAAYAAGALCDAIAAAQRRAIRAMDTIQRAAKGEPRPAAAEAPAAPAPSAAELIAREAGIPLAEADALIARSMAIATGEKPAAPAPAPAAPRLTEPRPTVAAKRRRAA